MNNSHQLIESATHLFQFGVPLKLLLHFPINTPLRSGLLANHFLLVNGKQASNLLFHNSNCSGFRKAKYFKTGNFPYFLQIY